MSKWLEGPSNGWSAIDYGIPAMLETVARLRDAKVTPVGAGRNLKKRSLRRS